MRALFILLAVPVLGLGCTRYWVGGGSSSNWNATSNTNWSTSSGGSNNASVPAGADDVCFDSNSGTSNSVISAGITINSLTMTGYTGTLTHDAFVVNIATNLTFASTFTYTISGTATTIRFDMAGSTGSYTCTTAGITMPSMEFNANGGTVTLQDNFTGSASSEFFLNRGTMNTNGMAVSVNNVNISGSTARTFTITNSTITVTGTGTVFTAATSTNLTINASGSTIVVSDTSSTAKTFIGGGQTYGAISITGGGTGAVSLTGANTFSTFTINPPKTVTFPASTTTTATTFSFPGISGNVITINSSSSGTQATISQASGTVNGTFLSLQDNAATGGATFNAIDSTDVSDVTGWNFISFAANQSVIMVGP